MLFLGGVPSHDQRSDPQRLVAGPALAHPRRDAHLHDCGAPRHRTRSCWRSRRRRSDGAGAPLGARRATLLPRTARLGELHGVARVHVVRSLRLPELLAGWSRPMQPSCRDRAALRVGNLVLSARLAHRDPRSRRLRLRLRDSGQAAAPLASGSVRRRMLIDFGLPLVFSCMLSLFSSLGLYRALDRIVRGNAKEVLALVGSFVVLVVTAGGVIVRAARELSRPMSFARASRGSRGPRRPRGGGAAGSKVRDEVVGLGDSIERMRGTLAKTRSPSSSPSAPASKRRWPRGPAALTRALAELKEAQAALLHGERMAASGSWWPAWRTRSTTRSTP